MIPRKKPLPSKTKTPAQMPKTSSWGGVAAWYDNHLEEGKDTYQEAVIAPNLSRVLEIKTGMKILDLACGQGYFSRIFFGRGAVVTGADISPELISAATKRSPKISFHATPAHKLGFAQGETFQAVTIVLAIQNIENMQEVFTEVWRVLKPGGKLVLVMNHPIFRNPKATHWVYDKDSNKQYRRIDSYLSQSTSVIDMHPGKTTQDATISYHRSLQDYFKALTKAKFLIGRLEEWISHKTSQPGPRQKAEDFARKEIPLFMMIEAIKQKNSHLS